MKLINVSHRTSHWKKGALRELVLMPPELNLIIIILQYTRFCDLNIINLAPNLRLEILDRDT